MLKRLGSLFRSPYLYLATFLNAVLVALGAWLHSISPYSHPYQFAGLVIFFLFLCLFDIFIKLLYERKQAFVVYEKFIDALLAAAAVAMLRVANPPHESVRVNVMLLDEKKGILTIRYFHGFAGSDRDRFINIPINTGCAGQAWLHCRAIVADPTQLFSESPVQWGLPSGEVNKIRPTLKSIFSIPIQVDNTCIGVLNIDSDNTKEEMKFDDEGVQLIGFSFASVLAVVLQQSP